MGLEEEIRTYFGNDFTWNGYVGVSSGFNDSITEYNSVLGDGYDYIVICGYICLYDLSKWGWTLSDKE